MGLCVDIMRVLFIFLTLSLANCQEDVSFWTNGRYTTSRTKNPAIGEALFLSAQVTGEPNEVWDVECTVTTPSGELWQVSFSSVYGEDGDINRVSLGTSLCPVSTILMALLPPLLVVLWDPL